MYANFPGRTQVKLQGNKRRGRHDGGDREKWDEEANEEGEEEEEEAAAAVVEERGIIQ